jgi:nicotinamide mononucleotide (NMN) deamidase PncC
MYMYILTMIYDLQVYTLDARIAFTGWTQATKDNYQGPTPDVVKGLADHTRSTLGSTYTVSESGIAGPAAAPFKGQDRARNRIP